MCHEKKSRKPEADNKELIGNCPLMCVTLIIQSESNWKFKKNLNFTQYPVGLNFQLKGGIQVFK